MEFPIGNCDPDAGGEDRGVCRGPTSKRYTTSKRANEAEADSMRNALRRYERLSGQAINFNKSNIIFSPITRTPDRNAVCQVLQVNEVQDNGKYLGMPMNVGRNKVAGFQFITNKVKKKLQNWGTKMISKAGKCTLLQTATQYVPNFWVNLFLIPMEVCESIELVMNGFLWGSGQQNRGIRWKAWNKLCVRKEAGGLEFREFRKFNISMLAKQGWRLINNDNPLMTSCMKAKYYPNGDFLNAELGSNPSYMWRNILAAQDLLRQGCRRRIGDGGQTEIWKIPWLPCELNGFVTTEMPAQFEGRKVCSLMQGVQRKWDDDILWDVFNKRDRSLIRKIPLSARRERDTWYWLPEERGMFSVKSCYRLLQGEVAAPFAHF
ncbi:hypothetical protein AgCh_009499 [Apium graveolens]